MSFRERLNQKMQEKAVEPENSEPADQEEEQSDQLDLFEPSPFFRVENVSNHPTCLELRLTNGLSRAIPYSYVVEIDFDPSEGVEILSTTKKIKITGRNLKQLYLFLVAFRVRYIEANIGNDLFDEDKPFVRNISVEDV